MNNARKLLRHDKVEVRQLEEGLRGSWHSGVVVGVSDSRRKVRYNDLLNESGRFKLVESIPVTRARACRNSIYRGRIRPLPPRKEPCSSSSGLKFGACVDVLYKEAWWEGVIFDDYEGDKERRVYFPDECDERVCKLSDMRVTFEWDELSGNWRERGVWLLVNLAREHKKDGNLCQLIRRVWSRLKVHYGYQKMISEWTCGAYHVWKEYFCEIIYEINTKRRAKAFVPAASNIHVAKSSSRRFKRGGYLSDSVFTRAMESRKNNEPRAKALVVPAASHRRVAKSSRSFKRGGYLSDSVFTRSMQRRKDNEHSAEGLVAPVVSHRHAVKSSRRYKRGGYMSDSVFTRSMQRRKNNGVNLAVKTRSMCMSKPENSSISTVMKGSHLTNSRCSQKHSTAADSCIITESPDARGECDQVASLHCAHLSVRVKEKGNISYGRDAQQCNRRTRASCCFKNHSKMPVQNRLRRQWHFVESSLTPRNLKPSVRDSTRKKKSPLTNHKISPRKRQKDNYKTKPTSYELDASKSSRKGDVLGSHCESVLPVTDSCQELGSEDTYNNPDKHMARRNRCCDSVCFICQYGDELLHCDHCLSSYHLSCVDLEEASTGGSFCPSCMCGLSGLKGCASNDKLFSDVCYQCSRQYHLACLHRSGISVSEDTRFCSKSCFEICARLHQLLQISNPTSVEGLNWTVTRSRRNDCNVCHERVHPLIQVSQVLNVFHECFQPIMEPHSGRDLVTDIVYNSSSKFRRLDFRGFYVMALVDGEKVACAATIRIHGQKVAEMPLIATPFKYRRQGMCRLLIHELEKMLVELGVERLVLPGIATLSDTWVSSFGFTEMPAFVRKELLGYPFVVFQGTTMYEKILSRSSKGRFLTAMNSSVKCGKQQNDVTRRVLRPITRTYSKKNKWNMDFPNLKLGYYEGCSQESMKLNKARKERSRKNCSKNELTRFNSCHKRRKLEPFNEEKAVMDGSGKNQPPYKCVIKRRRIQATRDSLDRL